MACPGIRFSNGRHNRLRLALPIKGHWLLTDKTPTDVTGSNAGEPYNVRLRRGSTALASLSLGNENPNGRDDALAGADNYHCAKCVIVLLEVSSLSFKLDHDPHRRRRDQRNSHGRKRCSIGSKNVSLLYEQSDHEPETI